MSKKNADLEAMVEAAARAERSWQSLHIEPREQIPEAIHEMYQEDVTVSAEAIASVLPDLGWVRQRTVAACGPDELDSLPIGTVVLNNDDNAWQKVGDELWFGDGIAGSRQRYPDCEWEGFIVLHEPGDDQ